MILLLDNYDSFTWNLFHYLEQLTDEKVVVKRNDEITLSEADRYSSFVLSPGPGLPSEAGMLNDLIERYSENKPILGICLGMQAIAEVHGGSLFNLSQPLHGVTRKVFIADESDPVLEGIPGAFETGHYHSWAVAEKNFPATFRITATDQDGIIMAMRHQTKPIHGLQFHPESVMTPYGLKMMENWLKSDRNR